MVSMVNGDKRSARSNQKPSGKFTHSFIQFFLPSCWLVVVRLACVLRYYSLVVINVLLLLLILDLYLLFVSLNRNPLLLSQLTVLHNYYY